MRQLVHPYGDLTGGQWLRGNLHTHTVQSDGVDTPQVVIDDYAALGHDFLMISDHDVLTSEEKYREWDTKGLIMIPGNEISAGGPHLQHVDADCHIAPQKSRQAVINEIDAATARTGRGFAVVNHPNWGMTFNHATMEQMREWTGYIGLEIYNGVISYLHGSPYATDRWDILLTEGRRLWGFATDDSHAARHRGMGWNVAYARERSVAGVVEALRNGRFYASTGVVITSIEVDGDTIRIETENARRICALQNTGRRFQVADGSSIEVTVPQGVTYVRFECWGDGESFAWTQPFYIEEDAAGDTEVTGFIETWQVSTLREHGDLTQATPDQATTLPSVPVACFPANHKAAGFVDFRRVTSGGDGIVYLSSGFESEADGTGLLKLGFDGPIRAWVNGEEVFFGPGTNPAVPDKVAVYCQFKKGANEIVVAVNTNGGKACGIFARVG